MVPGPGLRSGPVVWGEEVLHGEGSVVRKPGSLRVTVVDWVEVGSGSTGLEMGSVVPRVQV